MRQTKLPLNDCRMNSPAKHLVSEFMLQADDIPGVRNASAWLADAASEFNVPAEHSVRLDICLNEALANIMTHGGTGALSEPIRLSFITVCQQGECEALVTVSDAGNPFDTVSATPKARPDSLSEVEPGGLGLVMIRSSADTLSYRYCDGFNHLTFGVQWPARQP